MRLVSLLLGASALVMPAIADWDVIPLRLVNVTGQTPGQDPFRSWDLLVSHRPGPITYISYWTTDAAKEHYINSTTDGYFPMTFTRQFINDTAAPCNFTGSGLINCTCTFNPGDNPGNVADASWNMTASVESTDLDHPPLPFSISFIVSVTRALDGTSRQRTTWGISSGGCEPDQSCTGFTVADPFPQGPGSQGWAPTL